MVYMLTFGVYIYMVNLSIYTSTMDSMGFKKEPMASRDHIPIVPSHHPHRRGWLMVSPQIIPSRRCHHGFERGCLINGGWDELSEND